jgi:hypothetical protein
LARAAAPVLQRVTDDLAARQSDRLPIRTARRVFNKIGCRI